MVEFGIVISFNDHVSKRFGFVQPCDEEGNLKDEEDLFFHYNGYGIIGMQGDGVTPKLLSGRRYPMTPPTFPMVDDMLVFERRPTGQGHKAHRWVYAAAYRDALGHEDTMKTEPDDSVPLYYTQGGGYATYANGQYVWQEVPAEFPEFRVGDTIPDQWSTIPANEAARNEMLDDFENDDFPGNFR